MQVDISQSCTANGNKRRLLASRGWLTYRLWVHEPSRGPKGIKGKRRAREKNKKEGRQIASCGPGIRQSISISISMPSHSWTRFFGFASLPKPLHSPCSSPSSLYLRPTKLRHDFSPDISSSSSPEVDTEAERERGKLSSAGDENLPRLQSSSSSISGGTEVRVGTDIASPASVGVVVSAMPLAFAFGMPTNPGRSCATPLLETGRS